MPSIMDLVREYSELEMKRAERGGMLEPQLEIRYQALKFFLEFELFPTQIIKSVESTKPIEKKKVSDEIKKPVEQIEKTDAGSKSPDGFVEKDQVQNRIETTADLVSIISETTLPVSEDKTVPEPENKIVDIDIPTVQDIESVEIAPVELPPKTPSEESSTMPKEEVVEMEEVVEEAVKNIVEQDAVESKNPLGVESTEVSTNATDIVNAVVEESISVVEQPAEPKPIEVMDKSDLSEHIENAFNNVIQLDEADAGKVQPLENVLPDLPAMNQPREEIAQQAVPPLEITPIEAEEIMKNAEGQQPINIEDILSTALPSEVPSTEAAETPVLNIQELITPPTVVEAPQAEISPPQNEPQKADNQVNIDFLSGLDFTSPTPQNTITNDNANTAPAISIEELVPQDIISPVNAQGGGVREFVNSPTKAAVHMIDGDARRGIIKHLTDSQSEIEFFEDEKSDKAVKLPISSIKAIFVMKHPQEKSVDASGIRLNVKFKDDRNIIGISPDYSDEAKVFTLIPADSAHSVRLIVIYRDFIDKVDRI